MPKYLVEGRYTSEGLKGLAREGSSRRRADIAKTIESAGGKMEALYFAFGDADACTRARLQLDRVVCWRQSRCQLWHFQNRLQHRP
jgi:uncharacterized protein with GYD domain